MYLIEKIYQNEVLCKDRYDNQILIDKNLISNTEEIKEQDILLKVKNLYFKNKIKTEEGLKNLLKSIKGFGPKSIDKIIEYYKSKNIKPEHLRYVLEKEFLKNENLHLFNKKQKENFENFIKNDSKNIDSEEEFIKEIGLTDNFVKKLKNKKINIIKKLMENPYKLSFDIKGIGFKTIDNIALKIKEKYQHFDEEEFKIMRFSSAIFYALKEGEKEGHVFLAKKGIEYYLKTKLKLKEELTDKLFNTIIEILKNNNSIILTYFKNDKNYPIVYLKENYYMELSTAKNIVNKLKSNVNNIEIKKIIEPSEFKLSLKQKEAIKESLKNNLIIITGGPGTGKTTVAKYIYKNLKYYYPDKEIKVMAPTGTAAKRIGNVIGTKATTIHIGLKWKRGIFEYNQNNYLPADIVIIDESSMIDLPLFYSLISALSPETKLILIGDKDQLPPVGIGKPFESLLKTNIVPVVKLDKVYRQSEENPIASFAEAVNNGDTKGDWRYKFVKRNINYYQNLNIIIKRNYSKKENENYQENLTQDIIETFYYLYNNKKIDLLDIQILGITNNGKGSINDINYKVQKLINNNPFIENTKFKVGDKVIQTFNNYSINVMNGEIGKIIDFSNGIIKVKFIEGTIDKIVEYSLNKSDINYINKNITLAYAITIHKSQGNEWEYVIINLNNHYMLNKKLIYTAVTRSKKYAYIFTNYMYLLKGITTPFGVTTIEVDGKSKLIKINRNTLLDFYINSFIKEN